MTITKKYLCLTLATLMCCGVGQQTACMQQEKKYNPEASQRLLEAVKNNDLAGAIKALEENADINVQDKDGRTPLSWACTLDATKIIQLLIEKGALVNVQDNDGNTPLIQACIGNKAEIIKLLIEKGALVNVQANSGTTPLIWAFYHSNLAIVKLLLSKQALTQPALGYKTWPGPIQTFLRTVGYWTNLKNTQQATQLEIRRLTQNQSTFVPLLFRDGLIPKIMDNLTRTEQLALVQAFNAQVIAPNAPDRNVYLPADVNEVERQIRITKPVKQQLFAKLPMGTQCDVRFE